MHVDACMYAVCFVLIIICIFCNVVSCIAMCVCLYLSVECVCAHSAREEQLSQLV